MEQESKEDTKADPSQQRDDSEEEGEGEESKRTTVAIKPARNNKMSALSRIKTIQDSDWKTWKGPNVKQSGRPGTSGLIKARARKDPHKLQIKDEQRFKTTLKVLQKMQALDDNTMVQVSGMYLVIYILQSKNAKQIFFNQRNLSV